MKAVLTISLNVPESWEDLVLRARKTPDGLSEADVVDLLDDKNTVFSVEEIEIID